jgi:adenosine deaminase
LRLGHGVRIVEDTQIAGGEIVDLGPLARTIRDQRVPLELAISSNVHTGIVSSVEAHPVGALYRAGFAITLNTDNRLMSRTTLSAEFELAAHHHGFEPDDFLAVTEEALRVGFGDWPQRRRLLEDVVRPYYQELSTVSG